MTLLVGVRQLTVCAGTSTLIANPGQLTNTLPSTVQFLAMALANPPITEQPVIVQLSRLPHRFIPNPSWAQSITIQPSNVPPLLVVGPAAAQSMNVQSPT